MKKQLSFLVALCLVLSLCGAAFAAEAPESTAPPAAMVEEPAPASTPEPPAIPEDIRIQHWSPRAETEETDEETEETEESQETEQAEEERQGFLYTGLDPAESVGNIIVSNGLSWAAENSCVADRVEIEPGAIVEADRPVVILFSESDTVQDGEVRGNIRFISDYDEIVAIVHTNDTHGYLEVEPFVKGLADQLKASGAYSLVLTVSAGSVFSGGFAAAHVYNGEYIPYVMGGVYDFLAWGAEDVRLPEGDKQAYFLSILCEDAGVLPLAANRTALKHMDTELYAREYVPAVGAEEFASLYDGVALTEEGGMDYSALELESYALEKGDNVLTDGVLVETDRGTTLGLFGLSGWCDGSEGNIFISGQSTVEAAQIMATALRMEGADAVVGVGSTGWWGEDSEETGTGDVNAAQFVKSVQGLNAYVDGGTQAVIGNGCGWLYEGEGAGTLVNETAGDGAAIGVMYLILKDGQVRGVCGETLTPREDGYFTGVNPDAETRDRVLRCYSKLGEDGYNTAYAGSEVFLNGERVSAGNPGGGVRANETNLGDLLADGLLWIARQRGAGESPVAAIYPAALVGASLRPGGITLADALAVFSQPMQLVYRDYTARELVELMSGVCAGLGQDSASMLQVAGITCTYDRETQELVTLAVDDILYYDRGEYQMDEEHPVHAVTVIGADEEAAEENVIVATGAELAQLWCEFLQGGSYTIYPNELHPGGRIAPAPLPEEAESGE